MLARTDHPPETDTAGLQPPQRRLATAAVFASLVLVVLDGAIANVALPTIAGALHVSSAASIWIVTGYQLALVMALLPCAALGESIGHHRVFLGGVILFTAASACCALAPTLPWLVAARFVQGLGGASVMALGVALLRLAYPPGRLGGVIGWNALVIALAAAAGPTIGAAILAGSSWPWLFAVNLPVGFFVLIAGTALPRRPGTRRRLDRISVALNAACFAGLMLGVDQLADQLAAGVVLLVVSAAGFVALVRREMPQAAPLIPLDLLRGRSFRISVIASVCCFAGQMASYVALPFHLRHGLGQDALMTGLCMTPWPLTVAVAGPISGRLADRVSTGWLCAAGGVCLAAGLALAALVPPHGSLAMLVGSTMVAGLGFGFFQVPNNRNMLLSAPPARSGAAGGMQATARLVGQTLGAVIMTLLFTLASADAAPRIGLAIAAVLALAGGLVSALRATGD